MDQFITERVLRQMKKTVKRIIGLILVLALAAGGIFLWQNSSVADYSAKYAGVDLDTDVGNISQDHTYAAYLRQHTDAACPETSIEIGMEDYHSAEGAEMIPDPIDAGGGMVLLTQESSTVSWTVNVEEPGFYEICFLYCPVESRGIAAERGILINGQTPFRGADYQSFRRFWTDASEEPKFDNQGNQIRPQQKEVFRWAEKYACDDTNGYETDPYRFYFEKGENTLTLLGVNEPLALKRIVLTAVTEDVTYEAYLAAVGKELISGEAWTDKIQGENAVLRSEQSLYAAYDRSSPTTQPLSLSNTILNMIGGTSWTVNGQWIQWEITVPEDGWYNLAFKGRQNYNRGQSSIRSLQIDGETPFSEAEQISFQYSNDWQIKSLGDENGDYCFYLTEGTHTVRLTVALGEKGSTIQKIEDSVYRLNQIYRQLLVLMGRTPDKFRDYKVSETYPDMTAAMLLESQRLYQIADEITAFSGGRSSMTGSVVVLANMLEEFSEDDELIQRRLQNFRDNITALGTVMQNLTSSQLDIDYLMVKNLNARWTQDKSNLFRNVWHEVCSFVTSFTTDYDTLGNVYEDDAEVLEVWILTGRDQANILKTIIDDSFTPQTGISVNLKLVESGNVLSAVAAGTGPDIVLTAGQGEPVNYALRNAAEDLTQFEGWEEVYGRFNESAYLPYEYNGGIYGIPETQTFSVLYYRKDILEEIGVDVPETWDDLEYILSELQHSNMEVGMPNIMSGSDLSGFYAMLFQNGCELYEESGKYALLDAEGAIDAFERYSAFYTDYDVPQSYSLVDRFRSGEMPIGIADFTLQNTLAVFAPELKGLWDFALIPGTSQADGSVDHSVLSNSACSMMLKNVDEQTRQNGWEFLKWWTSAETQARFGREMECLMGSSARYATANLEAFQQLSWSADQLKVLNEARTWAQANREVAGGYYTGRHVVNAIRKVVNEQAVPRETLLDYNKTINEEIEKKRAEFKLD